MLRNAFSLLGLAASLALALAGCGDGSDEEDATVTVSPFPAGSASATTRPAQPTPRAPAEDEVAIIVVFGDTTYQPTVAEFKALPVLPAEGDRPEGVSLAVLASQVGAGPNSVVTVEGRSSDFANIRFWRGTLSEAAETMVVSLDEDGRARLAGSLIPEEAWLYAVESIAFE